jgi:tRNA-2-methylthio-N6-dimethylallyladenosine synthase
VKDIRRRIPDVTLTTDIICGFCGETEEEFLETYRTVEEVAYDGAFIFKYSERKHTIAKRQYPDDVPDPIKAERVSRLVKVQRAVSLEKNRMMIGKTVTVLVEGDAKKSSVQWMGRTDGNTTVVWGKTDPRTAPGQLIPIRITQASAATLVGHEVTSPVPTPPHL